MSEVTDNPNAVLAEKLGLIGAYYIIGNDPYRAKVYNEASQKIAEYPDKITSGAQARSAIVGIGKSIEESIDEYLRTGEIARLTNLQNQNPGSKSVVDFFTSIYGIGPVRAADYYNRGYRTLEDLWFKADLTDATKTAILWREHLDKRIPRDEMILINIRIGQILNPYGIKWDMLGSYRRGEPTSGDVDILVESRDDLNMAGMVQLLSPLIKANFANGPVMYRGIMQLDNDHYGHHLDIKIVPPGVYPFALMHFTGSQRFNILMRQRAISMGLSLNEYGLTGNGFNYPANSEQDIFNILRVQYIPPEARVKNLAALTFV